MLLTGVALCTFNRLKYNRRNHREAKLSTTRREFVERMAAGAVLAGGLPLTGRMERVITTVASPAKDQWDLTWARSVKKARHRAVFDSPEVESGLGVYRAGIWKGQVHDVQGVPLSEIASVVVIRHAGIILAMHQPFWDKYGIGAARKVTHPMTDAPTDRNPVLLSAAKGEIPAMLSASTLGNFIAGGGIALACNLALELGILPIIMEKDKLSHDDARKLAISMLVPGVILQPSGVFGIVHAQEAGAHYVGLS